MIDQVNNALRDRYRVEALVGRGGMATVYRAVDLRHERVVAIKVMNPDFAATVGRDRFLHEIRVTARLTHPHILALFDSGEASASTSGRTCIRSAASSTRCSRAHRPVACRRSRRLACPRR